MPGKTRPYEQFGPYILFKKLESDALSELWRAARIDDRHLGPLVALRRFTGGDREALLRNINEVRAIVPLLDGTTFVKGQILDSVDGIPYLAHEYGGGRSLRHVVDRARGGSGSPPNPIPLDQALLIAEKIALSLETVGELRAGSVRLLHGALLPQFVWISDEGEVRVAGQQLGKGLIASLKDPKAGGTIGRFISPEYQHSGQPTKASEVFSVGAILFLMITGHELPDAANVSAFGQSIRATKSMAGQPIPDDIRTILDKSLAIDPARRFESVAEMKQALSALVNGGKYSATTFNLAFYLSTLLKKELEAETLDRDKESKVNVAPYLEAVISGPVPAMTAPPQQKSGGMKPIIPIAAAVLLAAGSAGTWFALRGSAPKPAPQAAPLSRPAPASVSRPAPASQPVTAAAVVATPTQTTTIDPAAQKKAFEEAVNQKLQSEMTKLQADFNKRLQQPKEKPQTQTPLQTASVAPQRPAPAEEHAPSAAALDERRLAAERQEQTIAPPTQTVPLQSQTAVAQPAPAPAPDQTPAIREGDVVDFADLDVRPKPMSMPALIYPPMAKRQRVESSLIMTVFVSEAGRVLDVKVLKGDPRFGFEDEAVRALRATRFSPAMKDGKHVRTWLPQPIQFKLQ